MYFSVYHKTFIWTQKCVFFLIYNYWKPIFIRRFNISLLNETVLEILNETQNRNMYLNKYISQINLVTSIMPFQRRRISSPTWRTHKHTHHTRRRLVIQHKQTEFVRCAHVRHLDMSERYFNVDANTQRSPRLIYWCSSATVFVADAVGPWER